MLENYTIYLHIASLFNLIFVLILFFMSYYLYLILES